MIHKDKIDALVREYAPQLLDHLRKNIVKDSRTYGFEYEFLPEDPLSLTDMDRLYRFLPEIGYEKKGDYYLASSGIFITFEPGGQIEYHSIPMLPEDQNLFDVQISQITESNRKIHDQLGISYIARDYMPGRAYSPLCLTSERYENLHQRLAYSGTRGLEMMKGTASIHLHVAIRDLDEVVSLFSAIINMSQGDTFRMGTERRDIWNNTDDSRCGLPFTYTREFQKPEDVVKEVVRYTVNAYDISRKKPFYEAEGVTFDMFLYHITTIFTDIRLNFKGPTLELRTLDSMPFDNFKQKWNQFTAQMENV